MSYSLRDVLLEIVARVFRGPAFLIQAIRVATMSVVTSLLEAAGSGLAHDARRLKENALIISDATTLEARAKADERVAEARKRANEAAAESRRFALIDAEALERQANAAETAAKAAAIRIEAETNRLRAVAEARANLIARLTEFRNAGGTFAVDFGDIERALQSSMNGTEEKSALDPVLHSKIVALTSIPDVPIERLGLSGRTYSSLKKAGILNLRTLAIVSERELYEIRGIGPAPIAELKRVLAKHNLTLRQSRWIEP